MNNLTIKIFKNDKEVVTSEYPTYIYAYYEALSEGYSDKEAARVAEMTVDVIQNDNTDNVNMRKLVSFLLDNEEEDLMWQSADVIGDLYWSKCFGD